MSLRVNIRRKCIFYAAFSSLEKSRACGRKRLASDFMTVDKSKTRVNLTQRHNYEYLCVINLFLGESEYYVNGC